MIVTCEDCGATFNFNDSLIKPSGSKVRCSKCKSIFTVLPPAAVPSGDAVAADEPGPGAPQADAAPDAGDQALAELDSKLDDIFGDEGDGTPMADIGEMTDLDLEGAELSADLPDDAGDEDFTVDLDSDTDDLLAELDAEDIDLPDAGDLDVPAVEDEAVVDGDDDLDLGLDLLSEDDSEADLDDDELPQIDDLLDLSDEDFGVESDARETPDLEAVPDGQASDEELEAALELVDVEDTIEPPAEAPALDELDLGDDLDLGDIDDMADVAAADADELSLDLADEAVEMADETLDSVSADAAADDLDIDEIDLSDIEDMLSDDDDALGEPDALEADAESDAEAAEQLDLSDFARELAEDDGPAGAGFGGDAIELDLDLGDEIVPETSAPAAEEPDDELDFTDLADMLEPEETPAPVADAPGAEQDLELDLAATLEDAADTPPDAEALDLDSMLDGSEGGGAEEELDLTLELDGLPDDTPVAADSQPELEFDLEADLGDPENDFAQEDELELNLLDDDEPILGAAGVTTQAIPDDIDEATGAMAAGAQEIGATTDDFATEEFTDARDLTGDGDIMSAEDAALPPMAGKPKRSRKSLVAVLVGLVLIVAALIVPNLLGIHVPVLSDIKIPYLSDWIGGGGKSDLGNLKIIPLGKTINAKFVDNQSGGRLLVVSGQVRNEYEHARSFIQIAGKVFDQDGTMAKSVTVYAGNMISTLDLARLDLTKIKDQLQNKSGQRKSNLNVKKGRVVPFMIVFDQLPAGLDEYTIEVVGSTRKK